MISRRSLLLSTPAILATSKHSWSQSSEPLSPIDEELGELAPIDPADYGFGWVSDLPDLSDSLLTEFPIMEEISTRTIDLSSKFPKPLNQGSIGSCSANAVASAVQFARISTNKTPDFLPSRLFIYYYSRKIEGTIFMDRGAQLRTAIKVVRDYGVPPEELWPYKSKSPDKRTKVFPEDALAAQEPPNEVFQVASGYQTISYSRIQQTEKSIKSVISLGFPVIFGFRVYDNFDYYTKILDLPENVDSSGFGHAVLAVGFNDDTRYFKIRNSWGSNANDNGYFLMSYDYLLDPDLCRDFWAVYDTEAYMGGG